MAKKSTKRSTRSSKRKKKRVSSGKKPSRSKSNSSNSSIGGHGTVNCELSPRRESETNRGPGRGEILEPFQALAKKPKVEPPRETFIDGWYGSFGTRVSRALVGMASEPRRESSGPRIQEMVAEVIIGDDDRAKVNETLAYPYSAICSLRIEAANGLDYVGSGWLVDPETVITAGHNLFMRKQGGWAKSIEVLPGRSGSHKPHSIMAKSAMSVEGWTEDGIEANDYGAIRLEEPVSDQLGSFGFKVENQSELLSFNCHVVGFPSDKRGEMWGHVRRLKSVADDILTYEIDTYGGNSGCPVFVAQDNEVFVIGIHNYGDLSGNSATRITNQVYDNIEKWKSS